MIKTTHMEHTFLQEKPFGISVFNIDSLELNPGFPPNKNISERLTEFWIELFSDSGKSPLIRGTYFKNLKTILKTGVDVTPSNAPIFCDAFIDKAFEYGWANEDQKKSILLFYDSDKLERTFKEISSETPRHEFEKLKKIYPVVENFKDRSKIWLSRLKKEDPRRCSDYESNYAYWIPGNPFDALVWVMLIGDFNESESQKLKKQITEF